MCPKGNNCQQTLSESGSWPSDTMIILKQANSENVKGSTVMNAALAPAWLSVHFHTHVLIRHSERSEDGSESLNRTTHCALSACFEMILVSPDGQELANSHPLAKSKFLPMSCLISLECHPSSTAFLAKKNEGAHHFIP